MTNKLRGWTFELIPFLDLREVQNVTAGQQELLNFVSKSVELEVLALVRCLLSWQSFIGYKVNLFPDQEEKLPLYQSKPEHLVNYRAFDYIRMFILHETVFLLEFNLFFKKKSMNFKERECQTLKLRTVCYLSLGF